MENRFDFMDFLAYLLPGATALAPLVLVVPQVFGLSTATIIHGVKDVPATAVSILVLPMATAISYILGVLSSSLYPEWLEKWLRRTDPLEIIQPPEAETYVKAAFEKIFGKVDKWSSAHFFMSRAAVGEYVPNAGMRAYRQASLRQLRRNSILPILLWYIPCSSLVSEIVSDCTAKIAALVVLLVIFLFICYALFVKGVIANREREVREICCALPLVPAKIEKTPSKT